VYQRFLNLRDAIRYRLMVWLLCAAVVCAPDCEDGDRLVKMTRDWADYRDEAPSDG
jgi:hypothetical protein